jgi:diguanylate cyclase (GGDEF)-like protein
MVPSSKHISSRRSARVSIVGVSLALLLMWGSVAYYLITARESDIAVEQRDLARTARTVQAQTHHLFTFVRYFLATSDAWFQAHPDADPQGNPEFLKYVSAFRAETGGQVDIRMASADGGLFHLDEPGDEPLAKVADRDYFRAQLNPATRGFFIGKPIIGRVTGEWGVPVSLPLTSRPHGMAIIIATIRSRALDDAFEASRSRPNGTVAIAHRDGTVLYRAPAGNTIGKSGASGYLWTRQLPYQSEGTFQVDASVIDGQARVVAYNSVPSLPLVVVTSSATDDVLRGWRTKAWSAALFGALITLFSGLVLRRLLVSLRAMETAGRHLARQANVDYLTQVSNRRHFTERGNRELKRASRHGRPLTALMIDIDHFKRINDQYGHGTGDRVLQALASAVQGQLRESDILGRLGGEEFGVLLPETGAAAAREAAERIRRRVSALVIPADADATVSITLSIGVAERVSADDDLLSLLMRADGALYRAKEGGRDRVCIDDPASDAMPQTAAPPHQS